MNKVKNSQDLLLHTNFESSRLLTLSGENIKLYTVDEDENIFSNNTSEFFNFDEKFTFLDIEVIDRLIRLLWKTLNTENAESIHKDKFKLVRYLFLIIFSCLIMPSLISVRRI